MLKEELENERYNGLIKADRCSFSAYDQPHQYVQFHCGIDMGSALATDE